jgi:DNA-binding CsgD family transcriptional regulator
MARRGRPPYPDVLTPRQQEVLSLVRRGLSNEEIARELGISADGAKFHVSEILSRLGVNSRHEAARWRPEAPERASASIRSAAPRLGRGHAAGRRRRTYRYESACVRQRPRAGRKAVA